MNIQFEHLEHLISTSKYGSIARFFRSENVKMSAQNYYKIKRTTGKVKGYHVQEWAEVLGCDLSDIVSDDLPAKVNPYKVENNLLNQLVREKDARIEYLQSSLDKLTKKDKSDNG